MNPIRFYQWMWKKIENSEMNTVNVVDCLQNFPKLTSFQFPPKLHFACKIFLVKIATASYNEKI